MSQQPEALRLADATELRRLHAVESCAKVELLRRDNLIDSLHGLCESYRTQVESLQADPRIGKCQACGHECEACHSQNASQTPQTGLSLTAAPQQAEVTDAALIRELVDHIERNTCTHEGTHRGGAIWEVCDSCGARWADDEGGKPEFKWPAVVEKARAILALRPERVPLTDGQVWHNYALMSANGTAGFKMDALMRIVRAVEAHHGITAQSKKDTP